MQYDHGEKCWKSLLHNEMHEVIDEKMVKTYIIYIECPYSFPKRLKLDEKCRRVSLLI